MVDDHPIRARGLVELVRIWGHEARLASSPESALAQSRDAPPDLGVVDLGMRSGGAWELPERLRRALPERPLTLIAVGGPGPERSPARAAAAGFDLCLPKPVRLDTLRRLIEQGA